MRTAKLGTILITSILLMLIPTSKVHADPEPKTPATPDQLMPHAGPKPIPDIGNYHIITNLAPYLNPGTQNQEQELNIRFSTPEGYLCSINLGPHYPYDTGDFTTACIAHHFPGMPPPNYQPYNKNEKTLYEIIVMDNMMPLSDFSEVTKSDFNRYSGAKTGLDNLTAYDKGDHTKYPLLQPGNIITFTPPYSTRLYRGYNITPKPTSCALGYNHTLWCATYLLFNIKNTLYTDRNGKPIEFYITPTETKFNFY